MWLIPALCSATDGMMGVRVVLGGLLVSKCCEDSISLRGSALGSCAVRGGTG